MTPHRRRLGVLTPSSNTALEPLTSSLIAQVPNTSVHFSRFKVTQISLAEEDSAQFELEAMISAAMLLADARVDVIGWSGTSASWLGFEKDEALCQRITAETGIPCTTSILALNEALQNFGVDRFALVTPYTDAVQQKIIENYRQAGFEIASERHLSIEENFAFAEISAEQLSEQVHAVAAEGAPAIVLACTNLYSAHLVADWETQLGIPIFDTTTTVLWKILSLSQFEQSLPGWGRLLAGEVNHG